MCKEEIILRLLESLNREGCDYVLNRVGHAIMQYEQLVEKGIIKEQSQDENVKKGG